MKCSFCIQMCIFILTSTFVNLTALEQTRRPKPCEWLKFWCVTIVPLTPRSLQCGFVLINVLIVLINDRALHPCPVIGCLPCVLHLFFSLPLIRLYILTLVSLGSVLST